MGITDLPLAFIRIALVSAKEGHGLFVFDILRAIHHGSDFALGIASFCPCFTVLLGVAR